MALLFGACQTSCSGGGSQSSAPTDPGAPAAVAQPRDEPLALSSQITAVTSDAILATGPMMAMDVIVDPANMTAELLPARVVQAPPPSGQKFVVDLQDILTHDFCTDCLEVAGLNFNGAGNIELTLDLKHPMAAPNIIAGVGTAAFHVNNVRGFVAPSVFGPDGFPSGDDPLVHRPNGLNLPEPLGTGDNLQSVIAGFLANADGFSRDVTPIIAPGFDTIYPYIVFGADDGTVGTGNFDPVTGWSASLAAPTGYNVFAQGSTLSGKFELALNGA
ncbi:MAG: hypothetical protein ABI743_10530, partial [bacterium]